MNLEDLETQLTESEKQRLKNLTAEERLKEDLRKFVLKSEKVQIQPIIDIGIDRWFELQHEKAMERLEKLTPEERRKEDLKRIKILREAEKNNWYCSK